MCTDDEWNIPRWRSWRRSQRRRLWRTWRHWKNGKINSCKTIWRRRKGMWMMAHKLWVIQDFNEPALVDPLRLHKMSANFRFVWALFRTDINWRVWNAILRIWIGSIGISNRKRCSCNVGSLYFLLFWWNYFGFISNCYHNVLASKSNCIRNTFTHHVMYSRTQGGNL